MRTIHCAWVLALNIFPTIFSGIKLNEKIILEDHHTSKPIDILVQYDDLRNNRAVCKTGKARSLNLSILARESSYLLLYCRMH